MLHKLPLNSIHLGSQLGIFRFLRRGMCDMEDLLFIKGRFKNDVRLNVEKLISVYIQEGREREIKTRVSSSTPCSAHLTPRINGNAKNLLVRSTGDSQIQGLLLVTLISTRSAGIREEIDWCQLFFSSSLFYVRIKRCYSKNEERKFLPKLRIVISYIFHLSISIIFRFG